MQFRTDINGLRAYAVLAVMLFHFNKDWLPGGFVGVDIFFVISGYLMTSIIFRGLNNHSFSILKFYAARIRRIIPALLMLVILLITFGYFLISPILYRNLANEAIRGLLFVSNFLYWRDSGYFDADAFSKPLLHTWSLSVEWQFYIIYPVVLAILAKICSISILKKIIIAITFISLGFTVYFSYQNPIASYFLLPTRIWEMLLGGLIFLYPLKLTKTSHQYILEIVGIVLIILSMFIISENTLWPGYMALLPTLGAFILIQANGNSFITNNIFFQKIGLWSYSLYLYHWLIVFINHRYDLDMNVWTFFTLSFILAIISYYLIESRKWQAKYIIIAMFITLIPIYGIHKTKGASFRVIDKYVLTSTEFHYLYYGGGDFTVDKVAFTSSDKNFDYVMIGDSFARQYVKYLINNNIKAQTWFVNACLFMPEYIPIFKGQELETCSYLVNQFDQQTLKDNNKPLIWAQNWPYNNITDKNGHFTGLTINQNPAQYYNAILQGIQNMIQRNTHRNIYIIGDYSRPSYNVYECLSSKNLSLFSHSSCDEFRPQQSIPFNEQISKLTDAYSNAYFINPDNGFCDQRGCRMIINDEPMYSDEGHLSIYGADIVGKYIFDEIQRIENNQ